jgi:hypothetical protein
MSFARGAAGLTFTPVKSLVQFSTQNNFTNTSCTETSRHYLVPVGNQKELLHTSTTAVDIDYSTHQRIYEKS